MAVYSINKHQFTQVLKSKFAIAAEWILPKGEWYAVVMASGFLQIYQEEKEHPVPIM